MPITGTHIAYNYICKRKLWLFANGINMESNSEVVADGKLLHETSYPQRNVKYEELDISADFQNIALTGKVDFYDRNNKVIHEIKRSDKVDTAHQWQVKFYLWLLELNGISNAKGLLEYPKLRQTDEVVLTDSDRTYLEKIVLQIPKIIHSEECPPKINGKICKSCSYYELCYINEE